MFASLIPVVVSLLQTGVGQTLHVDRRAPGDTMTVFHPPRDISAVQRVIRWFFSVPQWVELSGALLAIVIALIALLVLWRNRRALWSWVGRRHETTPIGWKVAGAIAAIAVLAAAGTGGTAFFFYSQNQNQFCISCHELHDEVYQRFQQSKHHRIANLRCHDCHDEPMVDEVMQVVKWVAFRPSAVGPHAPVKRSVCATCHIKPDPDSTWKRIIATSGHSVHILSDTAKKLKIDCVTCHGVTAHRFVPTATTCQQSGCHEKTQIRLGRMALQPTQFHCTMCHAFTAPIRETANVDTARTSLIPSHQDCLACHAMQKQMADFVPAHDPHKGQCGACHDPHKQTEPKMAFQTCSNAGCHQRADTLTAFHRGLGQHALGNCGACHAAHTWKVKGTRCLDCHGNIFNQPPKRVTMTKAERLPVAAQ